MSHPNATITWQLELCLCPYNLAVQQKWMTEPNNVFKVEALAWQMFNDWNKYEMKERTDYCCWMGTEGEGREEGESMHVYTCVCVFLQRYKQNDSLKEL